MQQVKVGYAPNSVSDYSWEVSIIILIIYFIIINLLAFFIMRMDKTRAKRRERRVPERTLFMLAIFGGSLGIFAGMKSFRHKTKHKSFAIGIPFIFLTQLAVVVFILP
ncbi:DUF1294 domain-containing protein [Halalkalibacter lacteus]|uniref:DUF1294 domain-containing protein n=1 Tax=Halalkalibacter lacteus TaxID=3090663 RepID=UPI003D673D93